MASTRTLAPLTPRFGAAYSCQTYEYTKDPNTCQLRVAVDLSRGLALRGRLPFTGYLLPLISRGLLQSVSAVERVPELVRIEYNGGPRETARRSHL